MNTLKIIKIRVCTTDAKDIKTITFTHPGSVQPGQFYMIWIPGVDEIPMSISTINEETKGITFRKVGEATTALATLKPGDLIGVRGPYGRGFTLSGKHVLFVGGGTGIAMLAPAVEQAKKQGIDATVVIGVKNKTELFFDKRIKDTGANVFISTDDGSFGQKGLATDIAMDLLKKNTYSSVLTCGPEPMMKKLLDLCKNIPFQASLERYMKCSIGICGQCCIGRGLRVCKEGPVFDGKTLQNIEDFGNYRRDASGKKIQF
ncbi:MAG: dihydroorotate dehydrogenase electron transfer subunit [Euryarchaeota archaeon]|nr:dihydroorotate dehydrogenase electron transfer subunit [Euryarchaeota archaeon]